MQEKQEPSVIIEACPQTLQKKKKGKITNNFAV